MSQEFNPFQPPVAPSSTSFGPVDGQIDPVVHAKLIAIIKDANQFWIAILLCFVCTGVGMLIIGPWYLVRLFQWHRLAASDPNLLQANMPPGSLAQQFQVARVKLWIGLVVGAFFMLLLAVAIFLPFLFG